MTAAALTVHIAPLFMRALGKLCFLPIGQEGPVWAQRLILAAGTAVFFQTAGGAAAFSPGMLFTEFLTGALISLPLMILISSAGMCGEMFDCMRGQAMGVVYDPLSGAAQSFSGTFATAAGVACVVFAGGAEELMRSFSRSLAAYPPGSPMTNERAGRVFFSLTEGLTGCCRFFLPLGALLLAVDAGCALAAKILPGLSLQSETFQLKTAIGVLAVSLFWQSGASLSVRAFLDALP